MREVVRTNDTVLISALEALLTAAEIHHMVADGYISALEGSIGVLPRRILVVDDDVTRAISLLREAGFGDVLRDDI